MEQFNLKLKELAKKQAELDALTLEVKGLKQSVKILMEEMNETDVEMEGYHIYLEESTRQTVKKQDLVNLLVSKERQDLVKINMEPHMLLVEAALQSGELLEEEVSPFVKTSTTKSLKVKPL